MQSPIIFQAPGISPAARLICERIERQVTKRFPKRPVYWGYPKRILHKHTAQDQGQRLQQPHDILTDLAAQGHTRALVQPLQLLPGHEFHTLHQEVRQVAGIDSVMGLPLISSPADYQALLSMLEPALMAYEDRAVLIVGHGSRHPIWVAYLALEQLLQKIHGPRVQVAVIEHYPVKEDIADTIINAGYSEVVLVPLFMVAGIHYHRDMLGEHDSLKSRLTARNLKVSAVDKAIGMLSGLPELVVRHIEEADGQ